MSKRPLCSFNTNVSNINQIQIEQKQASILQQYNRLHQYQETPQYSIQTLPYSQLPKFANQQIINSFTQCIYLNQFTFYQMFTMLITQHLFKNPNLEKAKKVNHLKSLIYSPKFLENSTFTKGLLVKGFKMLQQISMIQQNVHPIGQCLLNSDSICAFSECWKQLSTKICQQNGIPIMTQTQIDSSIFEIFASYFHVNFNVYWKQKGNRLWKQYFTFQNSRENTQTLSLIVNPEYQISVSQRSIKVTQSRISGNSSTNKTSNAWNYIILTKNPNNLITETSSHNITLQPKQKISHKAAELPNGQEISRISEVDYSVGQTQQIKILLQDKSDNLGTIKKSGKIKKDQISADQALSNILNTMNKANNLIDQMRKYSQYLQRIQVPNFEILNKRF